VPGEAIDEPFVFTGSQEVLTVGIEPLGIPELGFGIRTCALPCRNDGSPHPKDYQHQRLE